jgi:redox-sensing transcriptional repressor
MRVGNLPGIRRLPMYLNLLRQFRNEGYPTVSATALALRAGLVTSVVRKDIEMTGAVGTTGVGYNTEALIAGIETFLGWDNPFDAFLIGVGSLGTALLGHKELRGHGLTFVAAFDADPAKAGMIVHGVEVLPVEKLPDLARRMHIGVGVLTLPPDQAQAAADMLVEAGITRIWSFAAGVLQVPEGVVVQREDLSAGLAVLLVRPTGQVQS